MKKMFSLVRASMTEGMNLFKISTKKKNTFTKIGLPVFLTLMLMMAMYSYSENMIIQLATVKMEIVLLTLFIMVTSIMTVVEGIYKSGNLLFNCKDDNLLLSLPIRKSTVLFIRMFKFYVFELLYNSIFLIPSMIVYAKYTNPSITYYIVSLIGVVVFPIIPILVSSLIGTIITFLASRFKGKNLAQTILTVIFMLGIMYISYNSNALIMNITDNASSINDFITKIYYPAGAYIELVTNFNPIKLLEFIVVNVCLFVITTMVMGKVYFNINSGVKAINLKKSNKKYTIKSTTPTRTLIKKELNRFVNSPVFITNAGFGLVLFILGCVLITVKFDSLAEIITKSDAGITLDYIKSYMPTILFGFICLTSFMTSITSSMISLEGKSFELLKSLPLKPYKIVRAKVLTAILIMLPCILIGDAIIFIRFGFDLLSIVFILIASILLPLCAETLGIIINLKYPRMDAKNDTEVVKQSSSSAISVFLGMAIIGITVAILFNAVGANISNSMIMLILIISYVAVYFLMEMALRKICGECFDNIG
ncbi:MAG: hypothetical protein IKD77_00985 [Bacilli bacterium]|nr:hypothetical protein [Bacilli bacterium]